MDPSCREGDFVLVNKISYLFSRPTVGQLVVLKDPRDFSCLVLKRITAVKDSVKDSIKDSFFWVEGDNKERSADSRNFGWVPQNLLLGRARLIHKTPPLAYGILS